MGGQVTQVPAPHMYTEALGSRSEPEAERGTQTLCIGISAYSWSSQTAQSPVRGIHYTLPTALWFQPSPHPLGILKIKGETLLANTRSANWTRAIRWVGIQSKAARVVLLSKNTTDIQDPAPFLSQHRKESKAFQKFPAPSAGEEVTPCRMSRAPVRSGCCSPVPPAPPQNPPSSCPR